MVFHTNGIRRRLTLAAALLGICFNATFMVWHAAGLLARTPEAARLAADLAVLCHGWAQLGRGSDTSPPDPSAPAGSDTLVCPICQAHVPTVAMIEVPRAVPPPCVALIRATYVEWPAGVSAVTIERPRNRDPPTIV
jgi:hypothetical protein